MNQIHEGWRYSQKGWLPKSLLLKTSGYGVFSMDYLGFGLSEGLHGYIPSFEELIDDVIEHFPKSGHGHSSRIFQASFLDSPWVGKWL